jgi:hypothetical protein
MKERTGENRTNSTAFLFPQHRILCEKPVRWWIWKLLVYSGRHY